MTLKALQDAGYVARDEATGEWKFLNERERTIEQAIQIAGHKIEGKKPSFVDDRRQLLTGLLWWTQKVGLPLVERAAPPTAA